jgi:hypothetical protein
MIVEEFSQCFALGAKLIYLGSEVQKSLILDKATFIKLGIPTSAKRKFPDVIFYDSKKKRLLLIEAAITRSHISPKRRLELETLLKNCKAGKIYVTAFWDFATYIKYSDDIAWETEVWIAEMPSHMIHFNGDKFLGPK